MKQAHAAWNKAFFLLATAPALAGELTFGNLPSSLGTGKDWEIGQAHLQWKGALGIGTTLRAENRDPALVTGPGMSTQNDGNLNYDKGDTVSRSVDAYVQAVLSMGDSGARFSAKAWYNQGLVQPSLGHSSSAPWQCNK